MRLPKDQDNWTAWHADKAIEIAEKEFARYEARINFGLPQEKQDEIYRPYQLAREQAVQVCQATTWRIKEAEALP